MRALVILFVLASFPLFVLLLRSAAARPWLFTAFGALPFLFGPLNLDGALINWPTWPGHTKGLTLTFLDTLALAVCLRYAHQHPRPPLLWLVMLYIASLLPGLLVSHMFQPSFFYLVQGLRIGLIFYAAYLIASRGYAPRIAQGLVVALLWNAAVVLPGWLSGNSQVPGVLGHQNTTGMAVNMCVPLLIVLGLRKKGGLYLLAAALGGFSALAGGSRATILLYGVAAVLTVLASVASRPTTRKTAVAVVAVLAMATGSPFAYQKLAERSSGGALELSIDGERLAFKRAAEMIISDHPWGVGLNQYVNVANVDGYMDRAGVRWGEGARSTSVHNTYLLTRAEGGLIALTGLLMWLLAPLLMALRGALQKRSPVLDIDIAIAVSLAVAAVHARYEWVLVTISPQYLLAIMIGILAANMALSRRAPLRLNGATRVNGEASGLQRPPSVA